VRRSHRLALSAAALGLACVVGGAALRFAATATAAGRGADDAGAATNASSVARWSDGAGRGARGARDPHAAGANAPAAPADAADGARRAPPAAPAALPIALEDPPRALGVALGVAGRDAGAPRALDLWRVDASGRPARVAQGHSEADGSIVFPSLVLPARAIELVAAPRGAGPRDASASPAIFVRRDPAAPRVAATPLGDGVVLQVRAAESGGAVVVETPDEAAGGVTTLARVDVEAGADAAPAPIEIALAAARGVALRVVQIDPDGRRSPPRPVYVDDDATQLMQEQE
jgi:hypothetical protein